MIRLGDLLDAIVWKKNVTVTFMLNGEENMETRASSPFLEKFMDITITGLAFGENQVKVWADGYEEEV